MGKWFCFLFMIGRSLGGVNVASENAQTTAGKWKECKVKENEGKQLGADELKNFWTRREEMQKRDAEGIKNGKVYLTKWCSVEHGEEVSTLEHSKKGTFGIFFGVEHRMREEELKEQFNKEAKKGQRLAADSARITDEKTSSEDRKHTSGGVYVAIDNNLEAVIGK